MKRRCLCSLVACAVAALAGALPGAAAPAKSRAVASSAEFRNEFTATLLPGGKVLVAGGSGEAAPKESALLYDPVADTWAPTGKMLEGRRLHTSTALKDGRVLVYGGRSVGGPDYNLATAEIYDPVAGSWSAAGSTGPRGETSQHMQAPAPGTGRMHHTATLLKDGRVLVSGGHTTGHGGGMDDAWLYDPASNAWGKTGSFATGRRSHSAVLLSDGRVLVTGGQQGGHDPSLNDGIVYDPASGQWRPAKGLMTAERGGHSSTLLETGKVLIAGGRAKLVGGGPQDTLATTEIYDPATGRFTPAAPMPSPRHFHQALTDPAGRVLVAGGVLGGSGEPARTLAAFDPQTGYWNQAGELPEVNSGESVLDYQAVSWLAEGTCGDGCREVLALTSAGGQIMAHHFGTAAGTVSRKASGGGPGVMLLAGVGGGVVAAALLVYFLVLSPGARRRRRRKAFTAG